jgi:hypothetical protein
MTPVNSYGCISGQEKVLDLGDFLLRCSQTPEGFKEALPQGLHERQVIMESMIREWYQPGPREHKLYKEAYRVIQQAELARLNIDDQQVTKMNQEWLKNYKNKKWEPAPLFKHPIHTISLFGSPGMGKTQFWDHVMNKCFKQVVLQSGRLKLCYLVINCSAFKSMKALCQSIFREFDQALINYYQAHGVEYSNPYLLEFDKSTYTAEKQLPYVANIAHNHRLGVLIIDEINHLTDGNKEFTHITNFFKNLSRSIGLPIIFSGTQDSLDKLAVNLQATRRLGAITEWKFYESGTVAWNRFIDGIWQFQITHKQSTLTDEIKIAYHKASGGVIDLCIKIHVKCQVEAAELKREVDSSFIIKITDKYFPALKKIVIGIHSKDPHILDRYKDIQVGFPTLVNSLNEKIDFTQVTKRIAGMSLNKTQVSILLDLLRSQYPEISEQNAVGMIEEVAQVKDEGNKKASNSSSTESLTRKPRGRKPKNLSEEDAIKAEKELREGGLCKDLNKA